MDFAPLTAYLDSLAGEGVPACDCVIHVNQQPVYRHIRGLAHPAQGVPASQDDLYWLYSASKVITCAAVMQLVEQGRLGLEDEVGRYLPEYAHLTVRKGDAVVAAQRPMTVRHLFTMCGGLTYDLYTLPVMETKERTGNRATTRELVEAFARNPLAFEPGTHFQYSLCHDVLAAVAEAVTGMTFGDYLSERIFRPLGMTDTGYRMTPQQRRRLSAQYQYDADSHAAVPVDGGNGFVLSDCYESGGAGLFGSVNDYIRFADALCCGGVGANGARILSAASIDQMRTCQVTGDCARDFDLVGRRGYGYGLGVRTLTDKSLGAKSPLGEFGWDSAGGAFILMDPDNRIALVYMQHVIGCAPAYDVFHPTIRDLAYTCLGL